MSPARKVAGAAVLVVGVAAMAVFCVWLARILGGDSGVWFVIGGSLAVTLFVNRRSIGRIARSFRSDGDDPATKSSDG